MRATLPVPDTSRLVAVTLPEKVAVSPVAPALMVVRPDTVLEIVDVPDNVSVPAVPPVEITVPVMPALSAKVTVPALLFMSKIPVKVSAKVIAPVPFIFNVAATTVIYTLTLHPAAPALMVVTPATVLEIVDVPAKVTVPAVPPVPTIVPVKFALSANVTVAALLFKSN